MRPAPGFRLFLFLSAALSLCRCMQPISGGGTEDGNATKLCGRVTDASGNGASGTRVFLLNEKYNPVQKQPVFDSYETVTDASGSYMFTLSAHTSGTYNIEAKGKSDGTKGLMTGIRIADEDTIAVPHCVLRQTGTVKLFLPDTLDTAGGYLFIPGTTIFADLSQSVAAGNGLILHIDGCPASILPSIIYGSKADPSNLLLLSDSVEVLPGDTTITGFFHFFRHYTKGTHGLPSDTINDLFLDRKGNKWFATAGGVALLRGETWTIYTAAPMELPDGHVHCVTADNQGLQWFGTDNGAVSFDGSQWTAYNPENLGLKFYEVSRIVCGLDGTMWFGGKCGIAHHNGASWQYFDTAYPGPGLPSNRIEDMIVDRKNRLWCVAVNGVARYDGGQWSSWAVAGINQTGFRRIMIDRCDRVWIGDTRGTVTVSSLPDTAEHTYDHSVSPILSACVNIVYEDSHGSVWIGTDKGLTEFDGTSWNDYTKETYAFLDGVSVYDIAMDYCRNVWLATDNGVIAFSRPIRMHFSNPVSPHPTETD